MQYATCRRTNKLDEMERIPLLNFYANQKIYTLGCFGRAIR